MFPVVYLLCMLLCILEGLRQRTTLQDLRFFVRSAKKSARQNAGFNHGCVCPQNTTSLGPIVTSLRLSRERVLLLLKLYSQMSNVRMNACSAISHKASQLHSVHYYLANKIVFNVRRKTALLIVGSHSSTGSEFQTVGLRQIRPADRVCNVDTAERSSGAG